MKSWNHCGWGHSEMVARVHTPSIPGAAVNRQVEQEEWSNSARSGRTPRAARSQRRVQRRNRDVASLSGTQRHGTKTRRGCTGRLLRRRGCRSATTATNARCNASRCGNGRTPRAARSQRRVQRRNRDVASLSGTQRHESKTRRGHAGRLLRRRGCRSATTATLPSAHARRPPLPSRLNPAARPPATTQYSEPSLIFKPRSFAIAEIDVGPVFRTRHELLPHWIGQNVIPFLSAALLVSQPVLEEVLLPGDADLFGRPFLPFAHDPPDWFGRWGKRQQRMQMIRHQQKHIRPPQICLLPMLDSFKQLCRHGRQGQLIAMALLTIDGDEIRFLVRINPQRNLVRKTVARARLHRATM